MQQNFRHVLKQKTDPHHFRVDEAFSSLDISSRQGITQFLGIHLHCFSAMADVAEVGTKTSARLTEMTDRIQSDLGGLKAPASTVSAPRLSGADPLALDYLVEGSRLGSRILKRRWETSSDDEVLAANAYFSMPNSADSWREVCEALAGVPVASARAARITTDTEKLYDMFYRVSAEWSTVAGQTKS